MQNDYRVHRLSITLVSRLMFKLNLRAQSSAQAGLPSSVESEQRFGPPSWFSSGVAAAAVKRPCRTPHRPHSSIKPGDRGNYACGYVAAWSTYSTVLPAQAGTPKYYIVT